MTFGRTAGIALLGFLVCSGSACHRQEEVPRVSASSTGSTPREMAPSHDHDHDHGPSTRPANRSEPARRYDGPLPPIPSVSFVPPRSPEVVKAAYDFAGRRPDVLQYVPCFCRCERSGHVGNDDCFVKSRDASGKPTWDLHGLG